MIHIQIEGARERANKKEKKKKRKEKEQLSGHNTLDFFVFFIIRGATITI